MKGTFLLMGLSSDYVQKLESSEDLSTDLEILQYFFAIQELIRFEKLVPASGHFA